MCGATRQIALPPSTLESLYVARPHRGPSRTTSDTPLASTRRGRTSSRYDLECAHWPSPGRSQGPSTSPQAFSPPRAALQCTSRCLPGASDRRLLLVLSPRPGHLTTRDAVPSQRHTCLLVVPSHISPRRPSHDARCSDQPTSATMCALPGIRKFLRGAGSPGRAGTCR
ncbi:hypothetical protein OH76DRAFT_556654 [Lentinus brumalis]|uniref:Uncharacterized protein n=1 Tax=Lentinus brumalis TaxID=2498619 RepID=A0A371D993_9APHY|nr:hypothetical protein OH76DRAFT_556654 [Polyporus brumalis]